MEVLEDGGDEVSGFGVSEESGGGILDQLESVHGSSFDAVE